jgi:hypothetical protein
VAVGGDHHVLGLEVAVDQVDRVGRGQPASGLDEASQDLRAAPRPRQPVAQVLTVDVLHRHEHVVVELADLVDRDDVGVLEPGERPALAQDLVPGRLAALVQHLEGDLPVEHGVVGDEHGAHATAAQPPQHGEAPEPERLRGRAEQAALQRRVQPTRVHVVLLRSDRPQVRE